MFIFRKRNPLDERGARGALWILVLLNLWIATVMCFGMQNSKKTVSREDAVSAEASYEACQRLEDRRGKKLSELLLRFSDLEEQRMDSAYISEELYESVHALAPGTRVSLLLHPNSPIILEFRVGERVILEFDRAMEALRRERIGFTLLGIIVYLNAVYLICFLWKKEARLPWKRPKGRHISETARADGPRRILRLYFTPLREMLLTGLGFAGVLLVMGLFTEQSGNWFWMCPVILAVLCLVSIRLLIYRIRVWRELRTGKPETRRIRADSITSDRKLCLLRYEEHEKCILTDETGRRYRVLCPACGVPDMDLKGLSCKLRFSPRPAFCCPLCPICQP